jgi:apolipoprotein D and lipocalin family protein
MLAAPLAMFASAAAALVPVPQFDLQRYTGRWYEIAAIPGFLQSRCTRDTQVEYSAAENGALASHTRCVTGDGSEERNEGRVRVLDPSVPAALKVTGVNFLGIWWYPFGRESIVLGVGPDYAWVVLGHPSLRYGRIIAREPSLPSDTLKTIAAMLTQQEFDTCRFVTTPQSQGNLVTSRLCDIAR